jgi:hypothetical protein
MFLRLMFNMVVFLSFDTFIFGKADFVNYVKTCFFFLALECLS